MPDSCSNCGELTAPALSSTSQRACAVTRPCGVCTSTPVQRRLPSAWRSMHRRVACDWVQSVKLGRLLQAGRKKALAVFQRQPAFWLTSK